MLKQVALYAMAPKALIQHDNSHAFVYPLVNLYSLLKIDTLLRLVRLEV